MYTLRCTYWIILDYTILIITQQHISANNQNHTNFSQLQFVMSQDVAVGRGGESEAGVLRARGFDRGLDRVVSSKKKGGKTGRSEQIQPLTA